MTIKKLELELNNYKKKADHNDFEDADDSALRRQTAKSLAKQQKQQQMMIMNDDDNNNDDRKNWNDGGQVEVF
jgi:hypothetical protein